MAAYRCADCDANWHQVKAALDCPACGAPTWPVDAQPNKTFADAAAARTARVQERTTEELLAVDELQAHRFARYRELGFTDIGAHLLSVAKDDAGFFLWWGHVKAALERGCTHAQAIAIYT